MIWNGLPDDVTSATSLGLLTFRQELKAHLFRQSYSTLSCGCLLGHYE